MRVGKHELRKKGAPPSKGQEMAARIQTLELANNKLQGLVSNLRNALYELLENDIIQLVEEKVRDEIEYRHPY